MNAFMKQNNDQMKAITETLGSFGGASRNVSSSGIPTPMINQNLKNVQAPVICMQRLQETMLELQIPEIDP